MAATYSILMMGASYGSLLASKLLFGDHSIQLVCRPAEAARINAEGFRVRLPVKGGRHVELDSKRLPGRVSAAAPEEVDPRDYDLVCLAMQEPQYRAPNVRALLDAVARSDVPCVSIMNMPPLPYLKRIPGLDARAVRPAYTDGSIWDGFEPGRITHCSADPQAIRPPGENMNVLHVTLPTNFKVARFESDEHTRILRRLQDEMDAIRYDAGSGNIELPVKLKVYDSVFVPLSKWPMLLTGNYRCITRDGLRSIDDAVHQDIVTARSVYDFVCDVCIRIGAVPEDLVPFEKYAAAAESLIQPSSPARAIGNGALDIERGDKLVQAVAAQNGLRHPVIDATVALIDAYLDANAARVPRRAERARNGGPHT